MIIFFLTLFFIKKVYLTEHENGTARWLLYIQFE